MRWTVDQALERPKQESIRPLAICTSHCLSFSLCGFIFTGKDALSYSWGMGKENVPPVQQHELWSILEVQTQNLLVTVCPKWRGYRVDTDANIIRLDVLEVFGTHRSQAAHPMNPQRHESATVHQQLYCSYLFCKPTWAPRFPFWPKIPGGPCLPLGPCSRRDIKIQPIFTQSFMPRASAKSSQTFAEQRYPDQIPHCVVSTKLSQVVSTRWHVHGPPTLHSLHLQDRA